jgi:hypothetical protein
MKTKDCGLITATNGVMMVTSFSDLEIDWKQVSESFKLEFASLYEEAHAILLSDFDVNRGLNYMTILERIGNTINSQILTKEDSFQTIWEKESEAILVELEIA